MNVGKYIYTKLSTDTAVSDLVGNRIYPVMMAEKTAFPAIVYTVNTTPKDTQKNRPTDHDREVVTFRFWADIQQGADGYGKTTAIDLAVRAALDFNEGTLSGVIVEHCHFDGSEDIVSEDRLLIGRQANYTFITKR